MATAEDMDGSEVLATEEIPDGCGCPVCLSFLVEPLTLRCGHSFCRLCLIQSTTLSPDGRSCPLCRVETMFTMRVFSDRWSVPGQGD